MWYASIKVRVSLMLFPASWHSMTIWNGSSFLFPWLSSQVERILHREHSILSLKKKKRKKHLTSTMLLALCVSNLTEGHGDQRPQTALIEAQLKHANALILFSLGVLLGCGISFDFCMPRITLCELSQHVFLSADASTSTSL